MYVFLAIVIILIIYILIVAAVAWLKADPRPAKLSPYKYLRKDYIMTQSEINLFRRLESLVGVKYYIFPQVHLSSLLNHQVRNGQDWRAALSKIQRKSVDFVLVSRETMITSYAIELDDITHDSPTRIERDSLVNEILYDAGIPLVRLRNIQKMSDEDITNTIRDSRLNV